MSDPATNEVTFTNTSNDAEDGTNLEPSWDFDDGTTSTEANPVHAFPGNGSHHVSLSVVDTQGPTPPPPRRSRPTRAWW